MTARQVFYGSLVLFFVLHLYRVNAPPNGYHQWRESDTAAVIQHYYEHDLTSLTPGTLEISSSTPVTKIEFPIYCILVALGCHVTGSAHVAAHLLSILAAVIALFCFYRAVGRLEDDSTAGWAVTAMAFSPLFFFYSYKIMPDILMMAFLLAALYLFILYVDTGRWWWLVGSLVTLSLAASIKPLALAIFLPQMYLIFGKFGARGRNTIILPIYMLLALVPASVWALHTGWLINRQDLAMAFPEFLFSTLFFKKMFLQWPVELWVGWVLAPAFIIGAWRMIKHKEGGVWLAWIVGGLATLAITASYSRQHDYYSLVMIPPCAAITGYGLRRLYNLFNAKTAFVVAVVVLAATGAAIRIHGRFGPTEEFYEMRRAADRMIPRTSKVVVEDKTHGAVRLYQLNRRGWYFKSTEQIAEVIKRAKEGAEFLILNDSLPANSPALAGLIIEEVGRIDSTYCYHIQPRDSTP